MESYIPISYLNDFIFCPRSIYFHQVYGAVDQSMYYETPQLEGTIAHQSIDDKYYSTKKSILQGLEVYCEAYNLVGKIDIFYMETGELVERKNFIKGTSIYSIWKNRGSLSTRCATHFWQFLCRNRWFL